MGVKQKQKRKKVKGSEDMYKSEALNDINGTISQIREYANRYANSGLEASYIANSIEQWLDQLRNDIRAYDDAKEDPEDE